MFWLQTIQLTAHQSCGRLCWVLTGQQTPDSPRWECWRSGQPWHPGYPMLLQGLGAVIMGKQREGASFQTHTHTHTHIYRHMHTHKHKNTRMDGVCLKTDTHSHLLEVFRGRNTHSLSYKSMANTQHTYTNTQIQTHKPQEIYRFAGAHSNTCTNLPAETHRNWWRQTCTQK